MASSDSISMAVFCDFENVALGVRDANYEKFDIKPVLERLLLKGSIVVKKAYCDWDRYKGFKATMHEANFELIEIPHVRQSGKNSADIRLVVDALDLCYTKSHVNTFVIISGDSDFSPLVSKLRENAKQVIGVGVKQSTSDLLVANCDEFIFYDDLVREKQRVAAKRDERKAAPARSRTPEESSRKKEELEARKSQAVDLVVEMFDALVAERGDSGKIWASLLKDTLKRRRPDFNETYYGFRTFGNLLEEAQQRGFLEFGRDEKSGAFVYRSNAAQAQAREAMQGNGADAVLAEDLLNDGEGGAVNPEAAQADAGQDARRRARGGRNRGQRGHRGAGDAVHPAESPAWYAPDNGLEDEAPSDTDTAAVDDDEEAGVFAEPQGQTVPAARPGAGDEDRSSVNAPADEAGAVTQDANRRDGERTGRTRGGRGRGPKNEAEVATALAVEPDLGAAVVLPEQAEQGETVEDTTGTVAEAPRAPRGRARTPARKAKAEMQAAAAANVAAPEPAPAEAPEQRNKPAKGEPAAKLEAPTETVEAPAEAKERRRPARKTAAKRADSVSAPAGVADAREAADTSASATAAPEMDLPEGGEGSAGEAARPGRSPRKGPARSRRGGR